MKKVFIKEQSISDTKRIEEERSIEVKKELETNNYEKLGNTVKLTEPLSVVQETGPVTKLNVGKLP